MIKIKFQYIFLLIENYKKLKLVNQINFISIFKVKCNYNNRDLYTTNRFKIKILIKYFFVINVKFIVLIIKKHKIFQN